MVKWSKTSPFHGGNPSSNLGRVTKEKTFERMSFSFSYRSCAFSMRPCYARRTRDTRLTASEERRKRKAFADIERSGHSKQIYTKCPYKVRLCASTNLFSVDASLCK